MWKSLFALLVAAGPAFAAPPNVLLVITDDQGYGDLGVHGNPRIRTPNLDAFAKQSVHLKNFYVSPVCAPTRASLLTGQYHYRTGVSDTYLGRALMRPDVKTLPEMLAAAGYRTGLFGKWHLGDNHPLRPEDRGFQQTLWSRGGGLAQPSDHPDMVWKTAYFDPILTKNGKEVKTKGYCTDVFTDAAVEFMQTKSDKPWFTYVAYNAPHGPLQVEEKLVEPFRRLDLGASGFPKIGQPWAGAKVNTEATARLYAMIENIDANFARLLKAADDNTLVIFLTDNGPDSARFNAGLRNSKGTVYEGGIRVPCYMQWKSAVIPPRGEISEPLAHIDLTPSILLAAGIEVPDGLDGRPFTGRFLGEVSREKGRTLFTQWHRGDVPEKYRSFSARGPQYKLVQANGGSWGDAKWKPKYELFDITKDPFEEKDLADENPEEAAKLKKEYESWFDYVTEKGFDPPRIIIGSEKENPVRLTRQDWRGPKAGWNKDSLGHWEVDIVRGGKYKVTIIAEGEFARYGGTIGAFGFDLAFKDGGIVSRQTETFELKPGKGKVEIAVADFDDKKKRGPMYVELEYVGR
jgi:arylsulfatase A-like enzyme